MELNIIKGKFETVLSKAKDTVTETTQKLSEKKIPCIIHHFATLEEAKMFAIKEQVNRRNLSGQALLDAVANFNFEKGKGNSSGEKGKASEIIAKQIGVSVKTVEKTRLVLKEGTPEQIEAIKKDELSMNQVFNQIVEKRKGTKKEKKDEKATSKSVKKGLSGNLFLLIKNNSEIVGHSPEKNVPLNESRKLKLSISLYAIKLILHFLSTKNYP